MEIKKSFIFGEYSESNDCPPDGSYCFNSKKCGMFMAMATHGGKDVHPTLAPMKPLSKPMSYGSWGAKALITSNVFKNFKLKTV